MPSLGEISNAQLDLPSWEDLISLYQRRLLQTPGLGYLHRYRYPFLKKRNEFLVKRIAGALFRIVRHSGIQAPDGKVWNELIDLASEQVVRDAELQLKLKTLSQDEIRSRGIGSGWSPRFNQLPCSYFHLKERVERIWQYVDVDTAILLLGDDDLLSIELAKRGFRDLTVLDIDPAVISKVRRLSQKHGLNVKTRVHDLGWEPPLDLQREYSLIFMDPPCSPEGLKLFLGAAMRFGSDASSGTIYFLCTHLMSQLREGIQELRAYLQAHHLKLVWFEPGFSVYPLHWGMRGLLGVVSRLLGAPAGLAAPGFLISDALVLIRDKE